jgi:hypothetical protein
MNEPTEIPPRRRIDWVSGLMAGVTVAASLGAAWFYFGRRPSERSLVVGSPAPLLQLIDLETSEPLVLAGLHGKVDVGALELTGDRASVEPAQGTPSVRDGRGSHRQ